MFVSLYASEKRWLKSGCAVCVQAEKQTKEHSWTLNFSIDCCQAVSYKSPLVRNEINR